MARRPCARDPPPARRPIAAYLDDVRNSRPCERRLMPTAVCDGIETHYEVTGCGPAAAPVLARRVQRDDRELAVVRHLPAPEPARPSERAVHVHRVRPPRVRAVGRARRAHHLGRLRGAGCRPARRTSTSSARICSAAASAARASPHSQSHIRSESSGWCCTRRRADRDTASPSSDRFAQHIAYLQQHDLASVVALARADDKSFSQDPRRGPMGAA